MKKFFSAIFILILVAAGAVGGFFIGKSYQATPMSASYVSDKIDMICKSAGWTSDKASAKTVHYTDYAPGTVNYNGYEDFAKAFVLFTKYAFETEDLKSQTYYVSESSYTVNNNTYYGKMGMYFTLEKNVANIWLHDYKANCSVLLKLDNNLQTNETGVIQIYSYSTWKLENGISYAEIRANTEKVTGFSYSEIVTEETNFANIEKADITKMNIYDCDILTRKQLNISLDDLTDEEIETYKTETVNKFDGVYSISFDKASFKTSDALDKVYKTLGYK